MSELYNHYVNGKKPTEITLGLVSDISRGEITRAELMPLISELNKNSKLNDSEVVIPPKDSWTEDYLKLLSKEVIRGVFSKQYLLHLTDVVEHIQQQGRYVIKSNNTETKIPWGYILLGIGAVALVIFIIYTFFF